MRADRASEVEGGVGILPPAPEDTISLKGLETVIPPHIAPDTNVPPANYLG